MSESNSSPIDQLSNSGSSKKYNSAQKRRCMDHIRSTELPSFPVEDIQIKELKEKLMLEKLRNADRCLELATLNQVNLAINEQIYQDRRELDRLYMRITDVILDAVEDESSVSVLDEEESSSEMTSNRLLELLQSTLPIAHVPEAESLLLSEYAGERPQENMHAGNVGRLKQSLAGQEKPNEPQHANSNAAELKEILDKGEVSPPRKEEEGLSNEVYGCLESK